jgi:hypothetical protein
MDVQYSILATHNPRKPIEIQGLINIGLTMDLIYNIPHAYSLESKIFPLNFQGNQQQFKDSH